MYFQEAPSFLCKKTRISKKKLRFDCGLFLAIYKSIV